MRELDVPKPTNHKVKKMRLPCVLSTFKGVCWIFWQYLRLRFFIHDSFSMFELAQVTFDEIFQQDVREPIGNKVEAAHVLSTLEVVCSMLQWLVKIIAAAPPRHCHCCSTAAVHCYCCCIAAAAAAVLKLCHCCTKTALSWIALLSNFAALVCLILNLTGLNF